MAMNMSNLEAQLSKSIKKVKCKHCKHCYRGYKCIHDVSAKEDARMDVVLLMEYGLPPLPYRFAPRGLQIKLVNKDGFCLLYKKRWWLLWIK